MHLALIGYRGTGKSTIAPQIALLRGVKAIDADGEIERTAGKSIREIFAEGGEARFRDLETQMLQALLQAPPSVLSLGGGVILRPENRALLKSCFTVWLTAPLETILKRLELDSQKRSQRPSLTSLPPAQEIAELLEQRNPLYAECADLTVSTEQLSVEETAKSILEAWQARDAAQAKR